MSKSTIKFTLDLLGKRQVAKSITSINLKISPPTKMTLKKYNPDYGKTFTKTVLTITFREESNQDSEWQPFPPKKSTKALLAYMLQSPLKLDLSTKAKPTKFKPVTDYSDVEENDTSYITIEEITSLTGKSADFDDQA